MRRVAPICCVLVALLVPAAARPDQGTGGGSTGTTGLVATFSFAGGGELGLGDGEKAGVAELEGTLGYEVSDSGFRPELGVAAGAAPDGHVALRPGVRFTLQPVGIQLRVALDAATSRGGDLRWRWLLLGAGYEVRLTSLLGFYGEIDSGAKLSSKSGVPLLVRFGASIRF
jgi:hypothetical protein